MNFFDVVRKNRPDFASEAWRVLELMRVSCGLSFFRFGSEGQCQIVYYFICPIFQAIVAIDNGINQYDTDQPPKYVNNTHLSSRVGKHNLDWTNPDQSSEKESFFFNQIQLSPCNRRLSLRGIDAQLAVFRPKVDELTFRTINGTDFDPVLEFQEGTLVNLYWKKFGCESCAERSAICLNKQDCATPISNCQTNGGSVDCNISLQLAFSGTDKTLDILNSWYEVEKLRQSSLVGL